MPNDREVIDLTTDTKTTTIEEVVSSSSTDSSSSSSIRKRKRVGGATKKTPTKRYKDAVLNSMMQSCHCKHPLGCVTFAYLDKNNFVPNDQHYSGILLEDGSRFTFSSEADFIRNENRVTWRDYVRENIETPIATFFPKSRIGIKSVATEFGSENRLSVFAIPTIEGINMCDSLTSLVDVSYICGCKDMLKGCLYKMLGKNPMIPKFHQSYHMQRIYDMTLNQVHKNWDEYCDLNYKMDTKKLKKTRCLHCCGQQGSSFLYNPYFRRSTTKPYNSFSKGWVPLLVHNHHENSRVQSLNQVRMGSKVQTFSKMDMQYDEGLIGGTIEKFYMPSVGLQVKIVHSITNVEEKNFFDTGKMSFVRPPGIGKQLRLMFHARDSAADLAECVEHMCSFPHGVAEIMTKYVFGDLEIVDPSTEKSAEIFYDGFVLLHHTNRSTRTMRSLLSDYSKLICAGNLFSLCRGNAKNKEGRQVTTSSMVNAMRVAMQIRSDQSTNHSKEYLHWSACACSGSPLGLIRTSKLARLKRFADYIEQNPHHSASRIMMDTMNNQFIQCWDFFSELVPCFREDTPNTFSRHTTKRNRQKKWIDKYFAEKLLATCYT